MAGTTLPRRALGRLLRDLRLRAGKSQLAAGLHIEVSKQTIGRVEDGEPTRISTVEYRALLELYGADDAAKDELLGLLREVRAAKGDSTRGWWRAYADVVNPHFDHFMSLEQACDRMTTYQATLLPGLLQTRDYRKWIARTTDPAMSAVDVERRLELLERRQARLTESPDFELSVLLSESALRHRVGGTSVMAEQLRHIADVSRLPNASIRVAPFEAEPHEGLLVGSFTLFEFPALSTNRRPEPPVVFVEGFTGALFLEEDALIERHRAAAETIQHATLDDESTRELVTQLAEEYERGL